MGILAQALEPKTLKCRHWAYAHAMLRMEWPQPLIYEALYTISMKHSLQLLPKEKEEDSWLGEDMFPSPSMIYFSSQPHRSVVFVYGTECSIQTPSDPQYY